MRNDAPIQLNQFRDFGQIISSTFQFLRQNWKPLYRTLVIVCLPIGLISSFFVGKTIGQLQNLGGRLGMGEDVFGEFSGNLLPMFGGNLLGMLMMVFLFAIVYEYLGAYHRGEQEALTTGYLWNKVIGNFWTYLGISFITLVLVVVGLMLCIAPGIWVGVALSLAYMVHAVERAGVGNSLQRSFNLIKERWWETFGLLIIVILIQSVITYAFMIPGMVISLAVGINTAIESTRGGGPADMSWYPLVMGIVNALSTLATILTYPIVGVALGLKYFAIVEEKEGLGLRQRIQSFEQA